MGVEIAADHGRQLERESGKRPRPDVVRALLAEQLGDDPTAQGLSVTELVDAWVARHGLAW